jgi:phage FluMu protein Com
MFAKCPRCQEQISNGLTAYSMTANDYVECFSLSVVAMACPHCRTILGISPDPVALAKGVAATALEADQGR